MSERSKRISVCGCKSLPEFGPRRGPSILTPLNRAQRGQSGVTTTFYPNAPEEQDNNTLGKVLFLYGELIGNL